METKNRSLSNLKILLLLALGFLTKCQTQNDTTSMKSTEIESTSKTPFVLPTKGDIPFVDSYFSGHQTVTSDKGPSTITRNVLQDKTGRFWFATWEGIVSYDGTEFTNHTNKNELNRYRAFTLLEDSKGNIWIGTVGAGLYKYDGTVFTQYTTDEGLASNTIGCLFEDKDQHLWIGTLEGVNKFDEGVFTTFKTKDGGDDDDINSIIQDKDGKLWIGARGKLVTLYDSTFTEVKNNDGTNFYNVRTIVKTKSDRIWVGGNNGLNSFNGTDWKNHSEDFTGSIFEDSKENIWVGKSGKTDLYGMVLFRYEPDPLPSRDAKEFEILIPEGQVFGITEDDQGNIWFGLENGIARYNGKQFEYFK